MNNLSKLDQAIRAVCPIHGVSIGSVGDPKTWRIDFKDGATPAQQDAARALLAAFVPADDPPQPTVQEQLDGLKLRVSALDKVAP